jgi:hypothetical protein
MAKETPRYTSDVPHKIENQIRKICGELPEAYEEQAWAGTRWRVRNRSFAHVLGVETPSEPPIVALVFRAEGEELEMLRNTGHPFFAMTWGHSAIGMVLTSDTDWDEVRELLTESFCVLAPKKLIAQVDRPVLEE